MEGDLLKADALRAELLALASGEAVIASIGGLHGKIWQRARPHLAISPGVRSTGRPGVMSEQELARRLASGDAAAFDALVELYAGKLLGYAQRSLSPSDAEDVVQEAFLVVVKKARTLAEHPNLGGFLFQTLRYLIIDRLRRQEKQPLSGADIEVQPPDEQADDLAAALIRQEDLQRVAQALHDACNPLEQDVMALALEGLDHRDIAQQLDLTANHVRVIKHRAIQKVRVALEVDHE